MWLDEDIEAALAWQAERDCRCPGCGLPTDETTAPGAAYIATPVVCTACRERGHQIESMRRDEVDLTGIHWIIRESPPLFAED